MARNKKQSYATPEEDPRFHDTYKFLRRYRDATYSLKVVVRQLEAQFRMEYGTSVDDFLDSVYAAGIELSGTDIAERAKSIERSNKMLKLLDSSVDLLRNNHKHGEQYYWILYYAFLSPQELKNTDEILEKLEPHISNIKIPINTGLPPSTKITLLKNTYLFLFYNLISYYNRKTRFFASYAIS